MSLKPPRLFQCRRSRDLMSLNPCRLALLRSVSIRGFSLGSVDFLPAVKRLT